MVHRLFQKAAVALFCLFLSVLVIGAVYAFVRPSRPTGMDMSLLPRMRHAPVSHLAQEQ